MTRRPSRVHARIFGHNTIVQLDERRLAGAGHVVRGAEAHRLERRPQRQHEPVFAKRGLKKSGPKANQTQALASWREAACYRGNV
jgi:hypothetical protein